MNSMNYMDLAFREAILAIGISRPNPAVGAVVVRDGIIVGKGHTQSPGNAHAEVMALRDAAGSAKGATLYVTLEPCCHYGRTPPCTKAIIDAGVKEVHFAHGDPNPVVRGKSKAILEDAGIVVFEETTDEIERFYEAYDCFVCNKRTFVEVKSALTKDGFIANIDGSPLAITSELANRWNHELRSFSDAILISWKTLLNDNPSLNVRLVQGNDPVQVIYLGHHQLSASEIETLKIFQSATKKIFFSLVDQPDLESSANRSVIDLEFLKAGTFENIWSQIIENLSSRGMHRLMVEPGAHLAAAILETKLWNRLDVWTSDKSVGTGLAYPTLPESATLRNQRNFGPDELKVFYPST